jgi:hypothetical protein
MNYVTHDILYRHCGENAPTAPTPHALYEHGAVDLAETRTACAQFDDDRLVSVKKWTVRRVTLPEWMTVKDFCHHGFIRLRYLEAFDVPLDWPAAWLDLVSSVGDDRKLGLVKLLKTKSFRSKFRQDMFDQIKEWLTTDPDSRKYDSPLSPAQWRAICGHSVHDSKSTARHAYWTSCADGVDVTAEYLEMKKTA